jgi:hypothetical protein
VDVQWEAPPECPDLASVRRYAERLLGQPLDSPRSRSVVARGKVQRDDAGYWQLELLVAVGEHVEEETLTAKKCRALADATALKLALACDPMAVVAAVQPAASEPALSASGVAAPGGSAQPARAGVERRAPSRSLWLGLRGAGGPQFGPLPGVTPGLALYGSLERGRLRVELGALYAWGGTARYAALPEVGAHLELLAGSARACFVPSRQRWSFPLCAAGELGNLRGEGFGVEQPFTAHSPWAAAVLGAASRFRLSSWLSLWLEADAVLAVVRPGFHMRNLQTLYLAPQLGARLAAGLELNFAL